MSLPGWRGQDVATWPGICRWDGGGRWPGTTSSTPQGRLRRPAPLDRHHQHRSPCPAEQQPVNTPDPRPVDLVHLKSGNRDQPITEYPSVDPGSVAWSTAMIEWGCVSSIWTGSNRSTTGMGTVSVIRSCAQWRPVCTRSWPGRTARWPASGVMNCGRVHLAAAVALDRAVGTEGV